MLVAGIFLCTARYCAGQTSVHQASIARTTKPDGWLIRTRSSAYQLIITPDRQVYPVYYGALAAADHPERTPLWAPRVPEVPTRKGSMAETTVLDVVFHDRDREVHLVYVSGTVTEVDGRPTLKIIEKDRTHPLEVISYIRVLGEYDVLEKWIEVKNQDPKFSVRIQNLLSGSILLPTDSYLLTQLSGHELGEFHPYRSLITPGVKVVENRQFKSTDNMPWFLVTPDGSQDPTHGPAWWGSVHYSGNWKLVFDNAYDRKYGFTLQIAGGINFWDTEWTLKPGATFTTPKFSTGYTQQGSEGAARSNAAYVRNTILPAAYRHQLRPVLYNGWVNTTYHVNDSIELAMARVAADVGVELFAIDDGWFKGRNSGGTGLGDWEVDKKKFPKGLGPLIDSVHHMGMKFGLWVEPESVVKGSELYQKHPDWVLGTYPTGQTPSRMFLNLAREDVFQYLFHSLDKVLSGNDIDFIKWDQNTYLGSVGWPGVPGDIAQEVRIRFIRNVYRLVDTLRMRHAKVLFESCASGGGRVDLGMLSRMDQVWTSDNSMAVDRLFIQYGYLGAMPANTMESWVLGNWNNQQDNQPSLSFKFDVAMTGVLGIGCDIMGWTPAEKALAKRKIEVYKEVRPLVQQGTLYRLVSPFTHNRCALQYNSAGRDSAVVFCYNLALYVTANYLPHAPLSAGAQALDRGSTFLRLQGLDPRANYGVRVAGETAESESRYTGAYLMDVGLIWPTNTPFDSRVLILHRR